jgi:hypothetical protein
MFSASTLSFRAVFLPEHMPALIVIPSGKGFPSASQFLHSKRIVRLWIASLQSQFDFDATAFY